MMKFSRFLALFLLCSLPALAGTVTFESLSSPTGINTPFFLYTEGGYTFSAVFGSGFITTGTSSLTFGGSTGLFNSSAGPTTVVTANDGSTFNLTSIDFRPFGGGSSTPALLTGLRSDGTTATQSFFASGTLFSTFAVSSDFQDLTSLTIWQGTPFGAQEFDNLVLTENVATPEPSSLLLLAPGLAGLLRLRSSRRR